MTAKIYSFFSTRGGVGKTTLALNLALALKDRVQAPVALIDFNVSKGGDILAFLDVADTDVRTIQEHIFENIKSFGPDMIQNYFYNYQGVDIIPFVTSYRVAKNIFFGIEKGAQIDIWQKLNNTINALSKYYKEIIIDCSCMFTSFALPIFDNSDYIFLTLEPEIISIDQSRWFFEEMKHLNFPLNKVKLLVNKCKSGSSEFKQRVKTQLGSEPFICIEKDEETLAKAMADAVPLMARFSVGKLRSDIEAFAAKCDALPKTVTDEFADLLKFLPGEQLLKSSDSQNISEEDINKYKSKVHQILVDSIDMKQDFTPEELKNLVDNEINRIFSIEEPPFKSRNAREDLKREIIDDILGLGPIEDLLINHEIDEIMVNSPDQIYIEEKGRIKLSDKKFINENQIMGVIERMLMPIGKSVNELNPYADGRLLDGSRINVIIKPLAIDSPMITIRKFSKRMLTPNELIHSFNTMNQDMSDFMQVLVQLRKNIIISGGTGTGKTTLLNVLSCYINPNERIITIEDSAELKLQQKHVGRLETRNANVEGQGKVNIRDLVRNALRMRPDRIIIGECRGEEALDMLQAMNTGHDGSISTVHSNSPHDALSRLETMVLMAGMELPARAIREQIVSAVDIIIQVARLADGTRKIINISEVTGMDNMLITVKDIFKFVHTGVNSSGDLEGYFTGTGYIPSFSNQFEAHGISIDTAIFKEIKKPVKRKKNPIKQKLKKE